MSSIIEEVTRVEKEAEQIRQDATASEREAVAAARAKTQEDMEAYRASWHDYRKKALENAQTEGEQKAREVYEARMRQTAEQCERAREKVPEAVEYLLGRIVGTL